MIIITLQRKKCIGCNYCVEYASEFFRMSKKDGKSSLLHSKEKKGFFTTKIPTSKEESSYKASLEACKKASKACPVKIISIKETF